MSRTFCDFSKSLSSIYLSKYMHPKIYIHIHVCSTCNAYMYIFVYVFVYVCISICIFACIYLHRYSYRFGGLASLKSAGQASRPEMQGRIDVAAQV